MALQKQNLPIKLGKGIDTKTDEKQVVAGKMLVAENVIFPTLDSFRKRNGYAPFSKNINNTLSTISVGKSISTFKDEIALFTDSKAYSYSPNTLKWFDKGYITPLEILARTVVRTTYQQTAADMAYHSSGVELYCYNDSSGGARFTLLDTTTTEVLIKDQLIAATASKPKPFAVGAYFVILYYDTSSHNIIAFPISATNPANAPTPFTVASDVNVANPNFDATSFNEHIYISYNTSNVSGDISTKVISQFLTIGLTFNTTDMSTPKNEAASGCINVSYDPTLNYVYVFYYNGTKVKYFILPASLDAGATTEILAPTDIDTVGTIDNIVSYTDNGSSQIFYSVHDSTSYKEYIKQDTVTSNGTVGTPAVFMRSVGVGAKPFRYNSKTFLPVVHSSTLQPTVFIVDTSTSVIVARFLAGVGGGLLSITSAPETVVVTDTKVAIPCLQKDNLTSVNGNIFSQTGVTAIYAEFNSQQVTAELGGNLHITGGVLSMYDGANVVEHGYFLFPENISGVEASGGVLATGKTYQYSIVYEWTDNQGQIHYSAPSVPVSVVTAHSPSKITLTIPTLRLTNKTTINIAVYRTEGDGTSFYRVNPATSPLINDKTVDTVSFVDDTVTDAALIGNQILYTSGGVLENICAPACKFVTTYKDRLLVIPSDVDNQIWYSKQMVTGVPVEFNDALLLTVDQAGGKLVTCSRLDSILVLFKETLPYYITGEGPDSTGASNDFSQPQPIASDVGCVDKRSVVLTPDGLMFKSQKGIYLMDRKLGVSYKGAPVEGYNSSHVISARMVSDTTQIRFSLDTGQVLMYDYYVDQWATFTRYNAIDSVIFQNKFTHLITSGTVMQETPGVYSDNGKFIPMKITTSWLSLAGLIGYQRVNRLMILGQYFTPHNLKVSVAFDFNPAAFQEVTIPAGSLFTSTTWGSDSFWGETSPWGGEQPTYLFQVSPSRQKCTSIQFTLEDIPTTSIDQGCALSALGLTVGVKQGQDKLAPTRSFG